MTSPGRQVHTKRAASGTTSAGWPVTTSSGSVAKRSRSSVGTVMQAASTSALWNERAIAGRSLAPTAWATTASSDMTTPIPNIATAMKIVFPRATAAIAAGETRPIMIVSTTPIVIIPTWTRTMGPAIVDSVWRSARNGCFAGAAIGSGRLIPRSPRRRTGRGAGAARRG